MEINTKKIAEIKDEIEIIKKSIADYPLDELSYNYLEELEEQLRKYENRNNNRNNTKRN